MEENFSLYTRMTEFGTITEKANEIPDVRFALPCTIHWIEGLALLVDDLNFVSARNFYLENTQRRNMAQAEVNSVCGQMLFALHQVASLRAMAEAPNKADVARMGIVAWYYGIYASASAMIAAADGSFQEDHAGTARQWDSIFACKNLAMPPFGDRVSSLLDDAVEKDLAPVRGRGKHSLTEKPSTVEEGWGCVAEYLAGTADWEQWNVRERVRETREFKALEVDNFRTRAARTLRDSFYEKRSVAFLHAAIRYRGKANYRDTVFLAYGKHVPKLVDGFLDDLEKVLIAFSTMAAGYVSIRLGKEIWIPFLNDLESKRAVSISPKEIWS